MHKVFVYGTLKKGNGLHRVLEACYCVAPVAYTVDSNFKMVYSMGERGFPFVFRIENGGRQIKGEVYEVDDEILKELDVIEGVPYMYERHTIEFIGADEETESSFRGKAYMYISPVERNGKECSVSYGCYDWP